ncbi:MAG: hypothetical protein LAO79_11595 [Acidobacteriia bacterium]|nr:hypothetical protein [Terriglobia bacterium]
MPAAYTAALESTKIVEPESVVAPPIRVAQSWRPDESNFPMTASGQGRIPERLKKHRPPPEPVWAAPGVLLMPRSESPVK